MTNDDPMQNAPPVKPQNAAPDPIRRRIDVADLLGDDREVCLVHRGAEYLLRLTSNGKLLLTK
jgi:hemin uptake protein HemP